MKLWTEVNQQFCTCEGTLAEIWLSVVDFKCN